MKTRSLTAVNPDIVAAQLEERGHVLEYKRERVGLPVFGIIGEYYFALDVCRSISCLFPVVVD